MAVIVDTQELPHGFEADVGESLGMDTNEVGAALVGPVDWAVTTFVTVLDVEA